MMLVISVSLVLLFGALFSAVYFGVFGSFPSESELASIHNEEASLVMSSDGTLIGKYFAENRTNISWNEVPEYLAEALVSTEDKRYYSHKGYDGRSYLRVFFKSIILGDKSSGGGSTLTQQLVKNLYGRNDHSFMSMPVNKLREAIIATRLEDVLTKQEILLLYLNSVPFGEEVYGVEAASKRYFDKHCSELNIQESAVLVGMLKANTYYNPRLNPKNATLRRNQVLKLMFNENYLSKKELDSLIILPLNLSYANYQGKAPAGYFVYQVKKRVNQILEEIAGIDGGSYDLEKDGLRITTTLDVNIQKYARNATKKQLLKMQKLLDKELLHNGKRKRWEKQIAKKYQAKELNKLSKNEVFNWGKPNEKEISITDSLWHYYRMLNAAVLIAEPTTGRVLTWIGGNDYRYLPYDLIFAKRQIASAIKPLIYSAGLENGLIPCSYLKNEIVEYEDYDNWKPQNYDRSSCKDSLVALWYALANSMNLPTMDLYFETGHDEVADMLRRFYLQVPAIETPAIALGALDVSLYEIVKAYGAFANFGSVFDDLVLIDRIQDANGKLIFESKPRVSNTIMEPEIADQITSILEKAVNEGTGRQLRNRFGIQCELAGKTGTAQNYSDAWFVAYTPDIVIGTWVGARSQDVHFMGGLGSGSVLALPIAGSILLDIESNNTLRQKYLTDFEIQNQTRSLLDCDPYYQKGFMGFINRARDKSEEEGYQKVDTIQEEETGEKKKSGIRRFFDRIFKGKKK